MGIFEGPFLFFWIFAGIVTLGYHAYFFYLSVIKYDAKEKESKEEEGDGRHTFTDEK